MKTHNRSSWTLLAFLLSLLALPLAGRVFESSSPLSYSDTPVVVKSWAATPEGITPTISGSLKPLGFTVKYFKLFREGDYLHFEFYGDSQIVDRSHRITSETENSVTFAIVRTGGSGSDRFEQKTEYTLTAGKNGEVTMNGKSELKQGWLSLFGGKSDTAVYTLKPLAPPAAK